MICRRRVSFAGVLIPSKDSDWRLCHEWLSRSGLTVGCCEFDGGSSLDVKEVGITSRVAHA
eukprot:2019416-Rhodomonas_salina.1